MADAVARWPTESRPSDAGARAATSDADAPGAAAAVTGAGRDDDAGEELWRRDDRRLVRRYDRRSARDVLVEERAAALTETELIALRRTAAAGGPYAQRVLRLSDDRTQIWYENVPGDPLPFEAMTGPEQALVRGARALLPDGAACGFVRTPGGPVLLVVVPFVVPFSS
jgi:hypothetical protein